MHTGLARGTSDRVLWNETPYPRLRQPSSTTPSTASRHHGVGFFDFPHGQRGVAPNAIELHPETSGA